MFSAGPGEFCSERLEGVADELGDRRKRLYDMLKPAHWPFGFDRESDLADDFVHRSPNTAGPDHGPGFAIGKYRE